MRFLRLCRAIGFSGLCLYVLAAPTSARAFTDPLKFGAPPAEGGTAGRWFTGAPTDGYGCDACHSGDKPHEKLVVTGLPKNGYVTNHQYEITISWPDFAARTDMLYPPNVPADQIPRAALTAELIAESAKDSGQIVQRALVHAEMGELCKGTTLKRLGASLFEQVPGQEKPKSVSVCDAVNTTRCLIAVRGCGSSQVHFTWFAPAKWQGTIWFSTSFVATDRINLAPTEDALTEVTIPLVPAGNEVFQSELEPVCTVKRVGSAGGSLAPVCCLCLLLVWRGRRSRAGGRR
ncbi:MAG TPA: hypothetical protein VJV78_23750 [Polyangiales bacterium]|nr:hypothetical protein [Polyangiales bacterium]